MIIDVDENLENADWTKQTADFDQFPGGFPQAAAMSGIPLEVAMKLPASYLPLVSREQVRYDDVVTDDLQGGPA